MKTGTQDLARTHVYRSGRPLSRAMANDQDVTPGDIGQSVFDLLGNAQEWTSDLWHEDETEQDESWIQAGEMSFRAERGLPPNAEQTDSILLVGTAHQTALCSTGACSPTTSDALSMVGFRCTRRPR